jgi:hypothetical protein
MNNLINQRAEMIINMANKGMNPQAVMQQIMGNNIMPQQIQTMRTQLTNMSKGKPMNDFILEALKQQGLSEQNAQGLAKLMGIN